MEIEILNITPINDIKEHTETIYCECKPKVEFLSDRTLIIHNSFDGREVVEFANSVLNKEN